MSPKDAQGSNEQKKFGGTCLDETASDRNSRVRYVDKLTVQATSHQPPSSTKPNAILALDDPIPIVDLRIETSQKRTDARKYIETLEKSVTAKYLRQNISGDAKGAPCLQEKPAPKGTHNTLLLQALVSEGHYDSTSIVDSIPEPNSIGTGRIRRSETERKQYFRNEPKCGSFKAHRAMCTRCRKWVRLSTRQTYSVKPWELHRTRCDQKIPAKSTYKNLGLVANPSFVVPRTEKVRKVLLELDDTASTVEYLRIKCTSCQQWVFLEEKYSLKSWATHKSACKNNLDPTDILKALERKLYFFCDIQFKCFLDPHLVECAACGQRIALNPDVDYDVQTWLLHKKYCQPNSGSYQGPEAAKNMSPAPDQGLHFPGAPLEAGVTQPDHSIPLLQTRSVISDAESVLTQAQPMSITDSECSLNPSPSTAASGSSISMSPLLPSATAMPGFKFLKRKRESFADEPQLSEDMNMDEEPSVQRPPIESYTLGDDPSGLGWFLLPFKAFVKGFKQSLTISNS